MLFAAYRSRNESLVKYLEEKHGVDVNKADENGWTPLFGACESRNLDLVKYLMEHGADVNKEDKDGETPLDLAYDFDYGNIIGYLEEKGAVRGEIEQFFRNSDNSSASGYEIFQKYRDDSSEESESSGDESVESDMSLD